jgi:hypothetical protein
VPAGEGAGLIQKGRPQLAARLTPGAADLALRTL